MKGLIQGMKAVGILMIIGTAGASDCMIIDFRRAVCQVLLGLTTVFAAYLLPMLGKGLRRIAVTLFCFR